MSHRKPVLAGNWKMNKTHLEAQEFVAGLSTAVKQESLVEMVLCAPFTALTTLQSELQNTQIGLGAQNMYTEDSGAFTGEVSAPMLIACGCKYVILGHSERREIFGENDVLINQKTRAALLKGLNPIVCVGETLNERESGGFEQKILNQVELALSGVQMIPSYTERVILAYEPIWAIGTGKTCDEQEANRILGLMRHKLAQIYSEDTAARIRLLYGGSVKPETIQAQMKMEHMDGALVGGASLLPEAFGKLVVGCKL